MYQDDAGRLAVDSLVSSLERASTLETELTKRSIIPIGREQVIDIAEIGNDIESGTELLQRTSKTRYIKQAPTLSEIAKDTDRQKVVRSGDFRAAKSEAVEITEASEHEALVELYDYLVNSEALFKEECDQTRLNRNTKIRNEFELFVCFNYALRFVCDGELKPDTPTLAATHLTSNEYNTKQRNQS